MIIYALDKNKNVVSADKAVSGIEYYCPICGTKLHVRKPSIENHPPYFMLYPGGKHYREECAVRDTADNGFIVTDETDLSGLPDKINHEPVHRTGGGHSGSGGDSTGERQPKILKGLRTLKDLFNFGITYMNADKKIGCNLVRDIALTMNTINDFSLPQDKEWSGFIHCKLCYSIDSEKTLFFTTYSKKRQIIISAVFKYPKDYRTTKEKYFKKDIMCEDTQTLITGSFTAVQCDDCFQPNCKYKEKCIGILQVQILNHDAVWKIPETRLKKIAQVYKSQKRYY